MGTGLFHEWWIYVHYTLAEYVWRTVPSFGMQVQALKDRGLNTACHSVWNLDEPEFWLQVQSLT
jgi:hypothetical protein